LRVQIPAKAKFAPTCVRNSLLSYLSWECITYLLICWFVYIGKNRRFTAFLDSKLHTRLAIVTANELGLAFPPRNLPEKICPDPSTFYLVIVVTDRQTDRQTDKQTDRQTYAGENIIPRESFCGDKKRAFLAGAPPQTCWMSFAALTGQGKEMREWGKCMIRREETCTALTNKKSKVSVHVSACLNDCSTSQKVI